MTRTPTALLIALLTVLPPSMCRAQTEAEKLHALFESEWERTMKENPTWASQLGDRRYGREWEDQTEAAILKSQEKTRAALARLRKIDITQLSTEDRLNHRLFEQEYDARVAQQPFQLHLIPLNQRGGIQDQSNLSRSLRFDSLADYEDWLTRLQRLPEQIDQTIALMRAGMAAGMLHPKVIMKRIPPQIRQQIVADPKTSLYYEAFRTFGIEISEADRRRLQTAALTTIEAEIVPAYQRFLTFFTEEYIPASFDQVGCWQRTNGRQMYAVLARKFTTTSLTPQQIHDIGQREVKRIRAEMQTIQKRVGFAGSFQEFLTHLRSAPEFYYEDPNDLLAAYRACCRRIDPQLPRLFHRLPKTPYEIVPIPAQMAPDTTTAYYQQPSADGSRPGRYFVNLYRPQDRPKYEIEALSLHESVPGHHFQIALAMELENVPSFRRYGGYTAFIEGWGLYSEKLGEELGLYQDDYSKFGQLTYEMWRAVRLVVDTGIHELQWTRQEAIDFFAANTAKSLLDIENEVDRYIAWPGQALAYKIGELRIRELRARAERQLGDRFNVKDFHEVVLKNGAVPLDILEEQVDSWLQTQG